MTAATNRRLAALALAAATLVAGVALAPASATSDRSPGAAAQTAPGRPDMDVRFATFNASLNRGAEGQLLADLSTPDNEQAQVIAEIIQRNDPDVLLVNEFDYVEGGAAAELFRDNYLAVGQNGAAPVDYPYYYVAPSNTGIPSGHDLNNDGVIGGGDDAFGFGLFPGQYGMVVFSKYPIDTDAVRTFQLFRWQDMPGNLMPTEFYSPEEQEILRLSSKSHWDVPIRVDRHKTVHFLVSHPTPPTFDGPEDRNGRRNHDEIRFWADYVGAPGKASYIYDDQGVRGGLEPGARFVIAGDQNADPLDGDSYDGAINQLLEHPRVNAGTPPTSEGAAEASELQGGINLEHLGDPHLDTADFAEPPGNIRVDYVLPGKSLRILDSGVFWPVSSDPLSWLTGTYPFPSSDHRLVWVDVKLPHKP
ncbi:endonuclease/exonuclease/phosphatase family protein [Ornithinimicrobium sp. F0845]|uniref:endonuclease/exonuclease/phosphatase family protein n=1 Tax=Ornithinimicrobium sp. F0845 TaxID=2926412 RepID=UPI001FF348F9|nr:endonuclease/exonuclease/phosphatase family protein [Ornithinimicrobium sp. F0845]MCK0110734.1 endonuclease/exonuclease/phosphatase family protein [Ornithinimicrobium sp. F0845]